MQIYVLGFLFNKNIDEVILILKGKPFWQKGLMNGVGGKVEDGESPYLAMCREWSEETGTPFDSWLHFCTMLGTDFKVFCYVGQDKNYIDPVESKFYNVRRTTDETPYQVNVANLHRWSCIPNLKWLIPMAVNYLGQPNFETTVTYAS